MPLAGPLPQAGRAMKHGMTAAGGDLSPAPRQAGASAPAADAPQAGVPAADAPGAGAPGADAPAVPGAAAGRAGRAGRRRVPGWWPLAAVLAVQAAGSLRLVRADTAFQDEALYLWAGHLQWAHWLHGAAVPPFAYYFSGAPVIYPPLGALADAAGGLAGARILSLAFMLGATALLWAAAGRLFGRRAAFFAAALFAVLGPTLHLGSFATYDAMSVFLIALAAWCVIRAGPRGEATGWMLAAGATLALANAAAYSSVLFDLIVLAVALLTALPSGGRLAARRAATAATVTAALLITGTLIGGSAYLTGIQQTTLNRAAGTDTPLAVLTASWSWAGLILALAICAVIISAASRQPPARTALLAVLALAAILGPLEQARLHTAASLNKHVGLGAWFAAIAAGYAIDKFIATAPAGRTRAIVSWSCVIALAFPLTLGLTQSRTFATTWPNATSFTAIFGPLADHGTGHLLVEDPSIAEYYLPAGTQWQRWSSTRNIILPSGNSTGHPTTAGVIGAGNPAAFARYITAGYFTLIALNYADTTTLDNTITTDLHHNPHYHLIQVIPYTTDTTPGHGTYIIWKYRPQP
jgi:Dolichyl-phosphate-mannose-protein mannosyltransferase